MREALNQVLMMLVRLYRHTLSPVLAFLFPGGGCRFEPTCSCYALEALQRHGPFRGSWLILKRLARCHPWGGCGHDPVPPATKQGGLPAADGQWQVASGKWQMADGRSEMGNRRWKMGRLEGVAGSRFNVQRSTFNVQRSMLNVQSLLSPPPVPRPSGPRLRPSH